MALIVILICLGIQRYGKFNSYSRQLNWAEPYFAWMTTKLEATLKGHGLLGVSILVLPPLIGVAIIFSLIDGVLGGFGYAVLSIFLLWYCLDARDIRNDPYEDRSPENLFLTSYRNLFGAIFWFAFFGPVGLSLYIIVVKLENVIVKQQSSSPEEPKTSLEEYMTKTLNILDWVPVRLLGLSYAVVGHFSSVFTSWLKKLSQGLSNTSALVAEWGMTALQHMATSDTSSESPEDKQEREAISLIDRSLLVWLIVLFLVTFGILLG